MTTRTTRALVAVVAAGSLLAGPAIALDAHAAPMPAATVVAKQGARGTTVKRIQTDLHSLGYVGSSSVTGYYGPVTTAAVKKFQAAHKLSATGVMDSTTDSLLRRTAWVKRTQRARAAEAAAARIIAKPGDKNATVQRIQGRLHGLGYLPASAVIGTYGPRTTAAVRAFQKANGIPVTGKVNGRTNDRIIARYKARATTRSSIRLDPRCLSGRVLCVDKSARTMRWVVNGQVKATYTVRVGRPSLATREGTFKIYLKHPNWYSTLYHVQMPYTQFFSGGQAVHYSRDFRINGYSGGGSHGCVNMRSLSDAKWLYSQTRVGDKVVVHR